MTLPEHSALPNARQLRGLVELENDLDRTTQHLAVIRSRVSAMRKEWAAEAQPVLSAPPLPAASPNVPRPFAVPPHAVPPHAAPPSSSPPVPVAATPPWWQREGAVSRVLSAVGAGVLLIGVTFLLVLAIQHGYFGPVPRVVVSAVAAGVLVGIGMVVHRRQPGNAGAVALVATGVAGGYLDLVAVTTIYGWVDLWVGLTLAGALFAAGLVLSRRWHSQVLSVIVVLGVVILAPVVGQDEPWMSCGFLIMVSVGATWAHHDRRWPVLQAVRVAPVALVLINTALEYSEGPFGGVPVGGDERLICAALATGFTLNTLLSETWLALRGRGSVVGTTMVGLATVPALFIVPWATDGWVTTVWLVALGLVWVAGAATTRRSGLVAVLLSAAALAPVIALTEVQSGELVVPGLLVIGVSYLAVARALTHRVVGGVGIGVSLVGVAAYLPIIDPLAFGPGFPPSVGGPAFAPLGVWDLVSSGLVLAVAVLAYGVARSWVTGSPQTWPLVGAWAVGLLGVTGVSVGTGVTLGRALDQLDSGFVAGHAAATLLWMAAAAGLLTRSRRRLAERQPAGKRDLAMGMVLAGLAVAKLLIFDLSTLDGLIRVLAFVVAGAVLLTLGTRYARSISAARGSV